MEARGETGGGAAAGSESPARPRPTPRELAAWPALERRNHRPTWRWRFLQLVVAASRDHAFLDRAWIGPLLRLTPRRRRRALAIRLLALSPHYWIYQWDNRYPAGMGRNEILEREVARVVASRETLCARLLRLFLRPEMTVLDFGAGPGFLALALSRHVAAVIATDVSRGVIACARCLNPAENLDYRVNRLGDLAVVSDASIDLACAFAVFQHLTREQSLTFFRELARVLKPGGTGLCHVILADPDDPRQWLDDVPRDWIDRRLSLRMTYFTAGELVSALAALGLEDIEIRRVADLAEVADDIGREQLLLFRRGGAAC